MRIVVLVPVQQDGWMATANVRYLCRALDALDITTMKSAEAVSESKYNKNSDNDCTKVIREDIMFRMLEFRFIHNLQYHMKIF